MNADTQATAYMADLDPEVMALEAEVYAARKTERRAGRRFNLRQEKAQSEAEQALAHLVGIARRYNGLSVGATCADLRTEFAAVHPELNRAGRRAFVKSFRLKGRRVRRG